MDNLTHSLTGLCMARAGLNRWAPDATPILLLAANVPDIDVVSGLGGSAALLHWHRNWTHSLPFSLVLAIAMVAVVRLVTRHRVGWIPAILAAWLGVLSHLLLDLTNNYGVRLLEPFSGRWFAWDITYVVDPYIWAVLLLALFAPLLGRLLSSELGTRRRIYPSRGWAVFALAFIVLFDCGRLVLHSRAIATLESRLYGGKTPLRTAAFPTALNPLQWQGLSETDDRAFLYDFNLTTEFDPASGKSFYRNDPGKTALILQKQRDFGALIEFAQYPLWRVVDDENNAIYRLTDLRFGDPVAQTFTCSARLIGVDTVVDERCDFSFAPAYGR